MEVNYFDIIVSIIILFLGLKGIINGFFKEVFGQIGRASCRERVSSPV